MRDKIVQLAKEYAESNVPYVHRGHSRKGCDCTGILLAIIQEIGFMRDYILPYYPEDWNLHKSRENILNEIKKVADRIELAKASVGDILLFQFGRCISHTGILVKPNLFVHCYKQAGKCRYGVLRNSMWQKRLIMAYRVNEEKIKDI